MAAASVPASAQITDLPPVSGIGRFLDTRTGFTWLDFSPYYNQSYSQQQAHLLPGYHFATLAQVEQLTLFSMPLNNGDLPTFDNYFNIVGAANTQNRRIIWGNYDAGAGINGWYYAYEGQTQWLHYVPNNSGPFPDLGVWAVDTTPIPEPASMTLLATGLVGVFAAARHRRKEQEAK